MKKEAIRLIKAFWEGTAFTKHGELKLFVSAKFRAITCVSEIEKAVFPNENSYHELKYTIKQITYDEYKKDSIN